MPGGPYYAYRPKTWDERAMLRIRENKAVLISTHREDGHYPNIPPKVLWDEWGGFGLDKIELGKRPALALLGENRETDEVGTGKRYKREDYIIERAVQASFLTLSDYLDHVENT